MNLNLRMSNIRKFILFIILGMALVNSNGQSNSNYTIGFSIGPNASLSLISGKAWGSYLDSSNSNQKLRTNLQFHAWWNKMIGKEGELQIGLGYADIGFKRTQENLKFKDVTFPGISSGMIEDLSSTQKQIDYYYKFQYLQIPVIWNMQIGRSSNFKYRYSFSSGITINTLLKHKLKAETITGYSIDGNTVFKLDSSGFNARKFSIQLQLGMKTEFKIDKKTQGFIQPMLVFYPISISSGDNSINPFILLVNVGLNYSFFE